MEKNAGSARGAGRTVRLFQVDAFTDRPFTGNPAGVVLDAERLTEGEMRAIARELNNSETAFVLPPDGPDHEVRIRFFTPRVEVPSCGHATVAAHHVRANELGLGPGRVLHRIGIGVLPVELEGGKGAWRVVMTQGEPRFDDPLPPSVREGVAAALGLGAEDLDPRCPVEIGTTGHSKVLVGIRSEEVLDGLDPDAGALSQLSRTMGCNGYYVFVLRPGTVEDEPLVSGRMFAPAIGIPEDPVTGNAVGPLGAYLVRHRLVETGGGRLSFRALQGRAMGRPGIAEVDVDVVGGVPTRVRVAGTAVTVFRTELTL